MTYKEMCEKISAKLKEKDIHRTPESIWMISSTGEIWPILELYMILFPDSDEAIGFRKEMEKLNEQKG